MEEENKNDEVKSATSQKDPKPLVLYVVLQLLAGIIGSFIVGIGIAISMEGLTASGDISGDVLDMMSTEVSSRMQGPEATAMLLSVGAFMNIVLAGIFIVLYKEKFKKDAGNLKGKNLKIAIIGGLIILVVNVILMNVFLYLKVPMENQNSVTNFINSPAVLLAMVDVILLAPLIEEMVMRYSVGTLIKNNIVFLIVSSLLFGIIHGIGVITILYIVLGLGFGLIYLKTNKNILAPIIAHIINNLFAAISIIITLVQG